MKNLTLRKTVEKWVREDINSIPTQMIAKLMQYESEDWEEITISDTEFDEELPMWGTMWQFIYSFDTDWLEEHIEEVSSCGFRIFKSKNFGYFFGIDGAGYDFYEAHWIPLYLARGLKWHV